MGAILIKLIIWFVLRQLDKWLGEIDWPTVGDDFNRRTKRLFPRRMFNDIIQVQCKQYILDLGHRFEAKQVMKHYGKQSWNGVCHEWLNHGSKDVYRDVIDMALKQDRWRSEVPTAPAKEVFELEEPTPTATQHEPVKARKGKKAK